MRIERFVAAGASIKATARNSRRVPEGHWWAGIFFIFGG